MESARALRELEALKLAADDPSVQSSGAAHETWKAKVEVLLASALGRDSELLQKFSKIHYWIGVYSDAPGERSRDAEFFREGLRKAVGIIDAAIYQIELEQVERSAPPSTAAYAPGEFTPFALSDEQIGLLRTIWNEVVGKTPEPGRWPTWDYVKWAFYRDFPDVESADEIYMSLPSRAPANLGNTAYGLVWQSEIGGEPFDQATVGLSIAGLAELVARGLAREELLQGFVDVLFMIASAEKLTVADPGTVASTDVEFEQFTRWMRQPTREKPTSIPDEVTAPLLQKEFGNPLNLFHLGDVWTLRISGHRLRRYLKLKSWQDYVAYTGIHALRESSAERITTGSDASMVHAGQNIFLVHGHDDAAKNSVARVVQQLTGEDPVILHEQASGGRTIIEKLDRYGEPASAAVVLLTPDDVGQARAAVKPNPRARQNVVFELGYFIGKLGRGRVIALTKGDVEIPSDISGVIYINMDGGEWKIALAQELEEIDGITVDRGKLKA